MNIIKHSTFVFSINLLSIQMEIILIRFKLRLYMYKNIIFNINFRKLYN